MLFQSSLNDWRQLTETGNLPEGSDLPDLVARRLDWEITAEFGFSGAFGATLENVGLAAVQPDPERFLAVVRDAHSRLTNELEELRRIDERFAGGLLAGVLRGLRRQGGIHHEHLRSYLRNDGAGRGGGCFDPEPRAAVRGVTVHRTQLKPRPTGRPPDRVNALLRDSG